MPLPLSELFISRMLPECFSLIVLISIKSTMIIDVGHHGIRLYEREVQPHEDFLGIDIAKLNHFAAEISSEGKIILEPFKFTNDADGFQLLISILESFDKNSIIIGLESTAHYGDNLVRYLVTELCKVCVDPIKTCQMRKNNVCKTKTDKVDTYVFTKTLMMQDNLRFVSFFYLDMMDLKALGRFRQKTINQRTLLKIQLKPMLIKCFQKSNTSLNPVCISTLSMLIKKSTLS